MGKSNNILLTVIAILQFVSIAFLIIGSVTAPVFHQIGLSKFEGITYGTFGYCLQGGCSKASSNYYPFSLTKDPSSWNIASSSRKSLGEILIVMPIAAGVNFFGFLTTIITMLISTFQSGEYTLLAFMINLVFGVLGFCAATLICVVVFLLFYPHVTWCSWLLIPAAAVSLLVIPLQFWSYFTKGTSAEKSAGEEIVSIPDGYNKYTASSELPPSVPQHSNAFTSFAPLPPNGGSVAYGESTSEKEDYTSSSNGDVDSGAIYHSFADVKETPPAISNLTYQSSPSYASSLLKEKSDIQVLTREKPQSSATSFENDNDNDNGATLNEEDGSGHMLAANDVSKPLLNSSPVSNKEQKIENALLPKFPVTAMVNSPSLASSVYSQRNNYIEDHTTKGRILQDMMKETHSLGSSGSRSAAGSDSGSFTNSQHHQYQQQKQQQQQQQQQISPHHHHHYHPHRTHSTDTRLSNLTSISRRYGNPEMYQSNSQSNLSVKRQLQNTPFPQSSPSSTSSPQFTGTQQTSLRPTQGLRRSTPPHSLHNVPLTSPSAAAPYPMPSPGTPAQVFVDASAVPVGPSPSDMIIRNDPNFLAPSYNRTGTQKVRMNYQYRQHQQQVANLQNPYGNANMILNMSSNDNLPAGNSHHYVPSYKRKHGYNNNKGSMMDEIRASGPYGIAHDMR